MNRPQSLPQAPAFHVESPAPDRVTSLRRAAPPAGALLAGFCFFLPWVDFSCSGYSDRLTGAQLGGVLWIVPLSAAVILSLWLISLRSKKAPATIWIRAVALAGLAAVAIRIAWAFLEPKPYLYWAIGPQVTIRPGIGSVGAILGLALAWLTAGGRSRQVAGTQPAAGERRSGNPGGPGAGQDGMKKTHHRT